MRNTDFTASMDFKQLGHLLANSPISISQDKMLAGVISTPIVPTSSIDSSLISLPCTTMDLSVIQQYLYLQQLSMNQTGGISPTILNPLMPLLTSSAPNQSIGSTNSDNSFLTAGANRSPDITNTDLFSINSLLNIVSQSPKKTEESTGGNDKFREGSQKITLDTNPATLEMLNIIYRPVVTPNGSLPASSPGTSQSSSSSSFYKAAEKEEEGDDESSLYVDVESVEVMVDGKDRRKAHVEFYRKMKSMRQREKMIQCAICKKKMENVENTIQTHVSEHADAGCYQCRLCGWQSHDKYRIYEHMRKEHPRKVEMFVDKRDMPKMCKVFSQCFPRINTRPKKDNDSDSYVTKLVLSMERLNQKSLQCVICNLEVRREKHALIRHVQSFHVLKCKTCKITTLTMDEQLKHQLEVHGQKSPKVSVDYAPSSAATFLRPVLEQCFPIPS